MVQTTPKPLRLQGGSQQLDSEDSFCRLPLPEDDCSYDDEEAGEECHDETLQSPGFFSSIAVSQC